MGATTPRRMDLHGPAYPAEYLIRLLRRRGKPNTTSVHDYGYYEIQRKPSGGNYFNRITSGDIPSCIGFTNEFYQVMKHRIFTRNVFIRTAFRHVLRQCCPDRNVCIVDIDSFYSFGKLLKAIEGVNLKDSQNIYLMTGISVHSKVLAPVAAFNRDDCLKGIMRCINKDKALSWSDLKQHLLEMVELSMMTKKEKQIAQAIVQYPTVFIVAKVFNANLKTCHAQVGVIKRKLNLRHITEVRQFIEIEMNNFD